ncbi:MAG: hypothetical protein RRA35_07670 [Desulfomonilia bacterium]|nr:hypothetical protein [Desulfomonilia bacterium]
MRGDPLQVIIMRVTDGKIIKTVGSWGVRFFFFLLAALIGVLISVSVLVVQNVRVLENKERAIVAQAEEIQELRVLMARKDEEMLSLKNRLSMAITYPPEQAPASPVISDLKPPIAGIAEISLAEGSISFKLENILSERGARATGHLFVVFRKGGQFLSHPETTLNNGVPADWERGMEFSIRNFRPISVKVPPEISRWERVTFYVFDTEGGMRLAMTIPREQLR